MLFPQVCGISKCGDFGQCTGQWQFFHWIRLFIPIDPQHTVFGYDLPKFRGPIVFSNPIVFLNPLRKRKRKKNAGLRNLRPIGRMHDTEKTRKRHRFPKSYMHCRAKQTLWMAIDFQKGNPIRLRKGSQATQHTKN